LASIVLPDQMFGVGQKDVKVAMSNLKLPITQATITWSIDGISQTPYYWTGYLATGTDTIFTIGSHNFTEGRHIISATVTVPEDDNTNNNTFQKIVDAVDAFFYESFEGDTSRWRFINGTQPNKWIVGTATASEGNRSAYVSYNGVDNEYVATASTVHIYCDITFPETTQDYLLQLDFKVNGLRLDGTPNTVRDYVNFYLTPTNIIPTAGSLPSSDNRLGFYDRRPDWTVQRFSLPSSLAGQTRRFIISYRNSSGSVNNPPAAIDNIAIVAYPPPPVIYSIALDKSGTQIFTTASYGYSDPAPLSVKITNIGNQSTDELTIALSGVNANSFTLSKTSISNIEVNKDSLFTVVPKTGLNIGIYTATVTVNGGNNIDSKTFNISFTVNDKLSGATVETPVLASKTDSSITVKKVDAPANGQTVQYAISTMPTAMSLSWRTDTVFTGLTENTTYYVYARAEGNNNYNEGVPSVSAAITTDITPIYSIVLDKSETQIFTEASYGYVAPTPLSVKIFNTGNQSTGALTITLSGTNASDFTLSKNVISNIVVDTDSLFTVVPKTDLAPGIYTATVTVNGGNNITSKSFNVNFTVNKAAGAIVATPVHASKTHNRITLMRVNTPANGQTVQYAISTSALATSLTWRTDTVFTGLTQSTTYYAYARAAGNAYYNDGTPTVSAAIITDPTPVYNFALDKSGTQEFANATLGYPEQEPLSVKISNTGNQPTEVLTIALNGINASDFMLSKNSISNIFGGVDSLFTVVPKTGLDTGAYTATVTVTSTVFSTVSRNFTVSFTVKPSLSTGIFAGATHASPLRVWFSNDALSIEGLIRGEIFEIYSASGKLVYQSIAASDKTVLFLKQLQPPGVYILRQSNRSLKFVY
jgi:hypothetical protein